MKPKNALIMHSRSMKGRQRNHGKGRQRGEQGFFRGGDC